MPEVDFRGYLEAIFTIYNLICDLIYEQKRLKIKFRLFIILKHWKLQYTTLSQLIESTTNLQPPFC